MEYFCSLLLLGINLYNYERRINKFAFFVIGLVLFCALLYFCYMKTHSFMGSCLSVMCHTWMNVFGDSAGELQITWFYLVGVLILGYFIVNIKTLMKRSVSPLMFCMLGFVAILLFYPLFLSPSLTQALKEFIMIAYFFILLFIALFFPESLSKEAREHVITAYIFSVSVACVVLIFQYLYYSVTGDTIFKYSVGNYFGRPMVTSKLLMEDTSSATIMLAVGVFYMLERINRNEKRLFYVFLIIITVIGLAFTTRRTSILSLAICLVLYALVRYKDIVKKIMMIGLIMGTVILMLSYLAFSRSIVSISDLIDPNGRIENYTRSIELFFRYPLGIGYDNEYLESFVEIMPHNTFLRWLNMCGIILAPAMLFILIYVIYIAWKKKHTDDFWVLACSLLAMNFIPDILNARFFVIPCMLTLMSKSKYCYESEKNKDKVDLASDKVNRLRRG